MNWYIRTILAQLVTEPTGLASYLERIGAAPDIINYLTSLDSQTSQYMINEFRKNPSLSLFQLQQIQLPQKINPYTDWELSKTRAYPEPMNKWILIQFRKIRQGRLIEFIYENPDIHNFYDRFADTLPQMLDWVERSNPKPEIFSYTAQQAIDATYKWHEEMASGEGEYEKTNPKLMVYGPNWKNKEWEGWTVQQINSENDLEAEGNKMDHCVGSYCSDMMDGRSIFYSLRDPNNNPHITIEVDNKYKTVEQIQGNSNSEPKDEYKAMIKEWITNKNPGITHKADPIEQLAEQFGGYDLGELGEALNMIGKIDEYGFKTEFISDAEIIAKDAISIEEERRDPRYSGDIVYIPELLIDAALKGSDKKEVIRNIADLEKYLWKISEETWDYIETSWYPSDGYPQEKDYDTEEEYKEAREQFEEWMDEERNTWYKETAKGGFANDGLNHINELRTNGILPSQEIMHPPKKEKK